MPKVSFARSERFAGSLQRFVVKNFDAAWRLHSHPGKFTVAPAMNEQIIKELVRAYGMELETVQNYIAACHWVPSQSASFVMNIFA